MSSEIELGQQKVSELVKPGMVEEVERCMEVKTVTVTTAVAA